MLENVSRDQELFIEYFECQSHGTDPDKPCILEVDRHSHHTLALIVAALFMFAPYILMTYIIPVDKFKEKLQPCVKTRK